MQLKIGDTVLSAGDSRPSTPGTPFGVSGITVSENPGVEIREYVGADRIEGEHVRCDHGSVSFQTHRVFATVEAAVAWAMSGHRAEAKAGALVFGSSTVFQRAVVTAKRLSQVGVSVVTQYTVEG